MLNKIILSLRSVLLLSHPSVDFKCKEFEVLLTLRSKRLNNYMVLSQQAAQQKSHEEISQYYKLRLYKYIHRYNP